MLCEYGFGVETAGTQIGINRSVCVGVYVYWVCLKVMIGASGNAIASQLFDQSELDSKKRPESVS